jgi:hypothetical protein
MDRTVTQKLFSRSYLPARLHDGLMMAGDLDHPFTLAFARAWAALGAQMRRDVAAALEQADAALALATEHGFPTVAALATTLRGRALAMRDKSEEGIALLSQGITSQSWKNVGFVGPLSGVHAFAPKDSCGSWNKGALAPAC